MTRIARSLACPKARLAVATVLASTLSGCSADDAAGTWAPQVASAECARPAPEWIWCDDFEEDRLASYFEYDDADGDFSRVDGVGLDGSRGMRARYREGQVDAGFLHLAFGRTPRSYFRPVDDGTRNYRTLYWRFYLRVPEIWAGDGGRKLSRAMILASPEHWGQAMIAHLWSGGPRGGDGVHLVIDPASGMGPDGRLATTAYNDFPNLRWLGLAASATPIFEAPHRGVWRCIEAHVTLNAPGRENGMFRLWIDEVLEAERLGLDWVGDFQDYGLNAVFLENYWDDGAPTTQERRLDNFVVSTDRIGCEPYTAGAVNPP